MDPNPKHSFVQLGVWTVVFNKPTLIPEWLSNFRNLKSKFWKKDRTKPGKSVFEMRTLVYLWTFLKEVYSLGPLYFLVEIFMNVWKIASSVMELYFTSSLLRSVTQSLETQQLDFDTVAQALVGKILLLVAQESVSKLGDKYKTILEERVKYHFVQKIMHSVLKFDLLTLEDPEVKSKIDKCGILTEPDTRMYEAFRDLLSTTTEYFRIISEISFIFHMFRGGSGFTLSIALALVRPLMRVLRGGLYNRSFVVFCSNLHFPRMLSLHMLGFNKGYREDRVTNNLGDYIEREFDKSRQELGDTCTKDYSIQWHKNRSIISEVFNTLAWDCTLPLFALRMLWDFSSVSIDELILTQQTSQSVHASFFRIIYSTERVSSNLATIRNTYSLAEVENKIKDGDLPYPLYSEEGNHSGAEIEFRNVSFKYPGTDNNALTDVSFTIKPGQLVVIVGVNGSGKSSAIKLLTRLYDPSSGEILLDGRPLPSYKLHDIRRATAILRQDHPVLPLSLRENVALGLPERNVDNDEVQTAICQGGADKVVQKLKNGPETILDPVNTVDTNFIGDTDEVLKKVVGDKEVETDLSGGETQRLSASRIFMRLMGGNIRLLAADEPTSALDPEGEYELFKKLREQSGGKTVIFVTHRFGHLTKYADLILCLKDGRLIEQGNHEELIAADGEYKKLYHMQARAFIESESE
ncbi:hypothetical protein ACEPAF_4187 [Sanghuangporus sanghuang]